MSSDTKFIVEIQKDEETFNYVQGIEFLITAFNYDRNDFDIFFLSTQDYVAKLKKELELLDLDKEFLEKEKRVYIELGEDKKFIDYLSRLETLKRQKMSMRKNIRYRDNTELSIEEVRSQRERDSWVSENKEMAFQQLNRLTNSERKIKEKIRDLTERLQKVEKVQDDYTLMGGKLDTSWCPLKQAVDKLVSMDKAFYVESRVI